MELNNFKYLLIATVIFLVGCSNSLTTPPEENSLARPSTVLTFELSERGHVLFYLSNSNLELVKILVNDQLPQGTHNVMWNGTDYNDNLVASGVYYYTLVTETSSETREMLFIK